MDDALCKSEEHPFTELVDFLKALRMGDVEHSRENLLSHLIHTYELLHRWNSSRELCIAGLFHSIYGTESFEFATVPPSDRQKIREQIGVEAEELVYLYCSCSRSSLYSNIDLGSPHFIRDSKSGELIYVGSETFARILTLDLANALEQIPRLDLGADIISADLAMHKKASRFLPEIAVTELNQALAAARCS
jgi:hypothetical protein